MRTSKTVDGVVHNYIYASGKLLRETYGNNVLDFFYDSNSTPFALKYNGTLYYYITNLQGDVMNLVDANGTVVATYDYDPFGNVIGLEGTMATTNPLRYRGYYYDSESSLYYLQSRYYDPAIGRFINADAYASTGQGFIGHNMFAYCGNDPINRIDPTGEWSWVGAVLGGITSAISSVMNRGSVVEILNETALGFVSGGCQSVVGSLVCILVESVYTILTSDRSDPIYLSLLLSIFSSQINGDNLNILLKGILDKDTINMFDWVFGTAVDLCAAGVDVLLQEGYSDSKEKGVDNSTRPHVDTTPSTALAPTSTIGGGAPLGFCANNVFSISRVY